MVITWGGDGQLNFLPLHRDLESSFLAGHFAGYFIVQDRAARLPRD